MTTHNIVKANIDWYEPAKESSQVSMIGYDRAQQIMGLRFRSTKDHEYLYSNVSPEQFHAFATAPSLGRHLIEHIKGKHAFTKIARAKEKS